ncbi:MAG: Mth938-like domain-containing protein [Candidatus Hadarchaeales archaeon]
MKIINGTSFGSITVNGRSYTHDVWLLASGELRRRDRNHEFILDEFLMLLEGGPEVVVVGTGQTGCVRIEEDVKEEAGRRGVELLWDKTPKALGLYNEAVKKGRRVAGAFHVTC